MPDQTTILAVLRGLHLAASLSLLGGVGFLAWVLPAAGPDGQPLQTPLIRLARVSGVAALLSGLGWFALQAAVIAGADTLRGLSDVLPVVAEHTRYGQVMLVRCGLLVLATLLAGRSRWRLYLALPILAIAVGTQGLIGHAGAMGGPKGDGIVLSEALHLIAAGLWLGGLIPLWLCVGRLRHWAGTAVCERFSPIGLACVLVIAGTGLAQGIELIGGIPALVGTRYGQVTLLKIGLFVVALALAAVNRLWLTDRLGTAVPGTAGRLRLSIVTEALLGLAIILAAGFLGSATPAAHAQPVWPFAWRFSLVTVNEDADLRFEVVMSVLLIGIIMLVLALAILWGRFRLLALAALAGVLVVRAPSLALLTVEAYPTSFQLSPTGFAADSIVRGQALYAANCVSCHGVSGSGNGPAAAALRIKPADLTQPHIWEHSDGEMFWWLTHGIDDPEGGVAMPGFAALPAADRWALIDYVRAHNAGLGVQLDAAFDVPVAAPAMPIRCAGLNATEMTDLRGMAVHVVTAGAATEPGPIAPLPGVRLVTLDVRPEQPDPAAAGTCVAATPAAWPAYAVLADVPPDSLSGTEFLIDPDGWLRAEHQAGASGGWHSRDDLAAAVRGICASPLHASSGGEHEHHH